MTSEASNGYTIPDIYANLSELACSAPVENPKELDLYHHHSLEEIRTREQDYMRYKRSVGNHHALVDPDENRAVNVAKARTVFCCTFWAGLRDLVLRR